MINYNDHTMSIKDLRIGYYNIYPRWKWLQIKKLWKLLIDRDMKKKDLSGLAGISNTSIAKLGRNENVTMDVLVKICIAIKCEIWDIVEIIPGDK